MPLSPANIEQSVRPTDFDRALAILKRRAGFIAFCCLGFTAIAIIVSLVQQKQYSASASLLFRNPGFAEDLFGTSAVAANPAPTREAATNVKLVGLHVVAQRTAREIPELSASEISAMVAVAPQGEAELVSVTATNADPTVARRVANIFAQQFIAFRAHTDKSKLLTAKRLAERELQRLSGQERVGPRGEALSRSAEKLGILASLQTGNAELVQPAQLPTSPSSPKPKRNAILGAILGLLVGIGLSFLLERLNRRVRDPEEAQEAFGLPILGTIPESKAIVESNKGATAQELPFMENEAFRMLRASLRYFNVDRNMRSVLITSHVAGAGKSTVSWNLGRVAATSAKAIVLETDLRNPHMARQHGLRPGPGLAEVLTHQVDLDKAIQSKPLAMSAKGADGGECAMDVVVAGSLPPNPAELLESKTMSEVLAQLKERYDLIVVDTAPIGVVSDAFPLLGQVDGVIVVARMEQTTRDSAKHLGEQLERIDAPVLGLVANAIKQRRGKKYGYGYYGGYYGHSAEKASEPESASHA